MRGIIFTTFTDFMEYEFGYDILDKILLERDYPNMGGFSSGANYGIEYLYHIVNDSSKYFNGGSEELLYLFGKYAFRSLVLRFRKIYQNKNPFLLVDSAFDFIINLNDLHFEELYKLYPNAKFPRFDIVKENNSIELVYSSPLQLHYLVKGLLQGCLDFFEDSSTVSMIISEDNKKSTFYIKKEV